MKNTPRARLVSLAAVAPRAALVAALAVAASAAVPSDIANRVKTYKAIPAFVPPGPAIDASKARGKTIFIIPESSSIPFINTIDNSIVKVAKLLGIKTTDLHEPGAAVAVGGRREPGDRPEARPDHAPGRARPARAPAAARSRRRRRGSRCS